MGPHGRALIQARRWRTALPLPNGCVCSGDTGWGEGPSHGASSVQVLPLMLGEDALKTLLPTALGARRSADTGPMAEVPAADTGPRGPSLLALVQGL